MLTKGDDYPLHQTSEPIAFAGTDRNFYDRYFFNGYSADGSVFFAAAMGFYPQLGIVDASFCVIAEGCSIICAPAVVRAANGSTCRSAPSPSRSTNRCKK